MWGVAAAAVVLVAGVLYGIGAFEPRAVPAEGAGPKAAPVAEKPAETAVPVKPPAQAGAIPASVSVRLRAAESCWVTVSVGEKPAYTGVLEAGQTKTFEASEPIRVRTGNAGGLSIDWNGKPVGPLGPHGQIRLLELSPSSFRFVALPAAKPPSPAAGL
jgi:cytoskeleton protein RodZ